MAPKRLRLEGATLPELQARVAAEHGGGARIIAAEQVTVGGIRGFFAKRHIEVTVEISADEPAEVLVQVPARRRRTTPARNELSTRLGIAALLDDADETESRLHGDGAPRPTGDPAADTAFPGTVSSGTVLPGTVSSGTAPTRRRARGPAAPAEGVSTGTPDFARLMDELTFATSPARVPPATPAPATPAPALPAAPAPAPAVVAPPQWDTVAPTDAAAASAAPEQPPQLSPEAPRMLDGPGDLVLLIGLHADVQETVRLLSTGTAAPLFDGPDRVTDRRSALAARARGVEQGRSVLVVQAVPGRPVAAVGADQVWVVVHAGRKPSDTARWVRDVGADITIDAVAVLGIDSTSTPGTVRELGLPIGWLAPPTGPQASAGPTDPFAIG